MGTLSLPVRSNATLLKKSRRPSLRDISGGRKGSRTLDGHQLRTLQEERSVVRSAEFQIELKRYEVGRGRDDCIAAATKG